MPPSHTRRPAANGAPRRAGLLLALVALVLVPTEPIRADDALMKLVPADAGLIASIDGFRDHSRAILETRIAREFQELPAFQAWRQSPNVRNFLTASKHIEGFLQTSLREIGDEIFGDAVVLALFAPTDSPADARGLFILRARDPKLLNQLLDRINTAQKTSGELAALVEHKRGDSTYFTRQYRAGSDQPDETFVVFDDGVFALSNAESRIQWVIDRKATPEGDSAADLAGFQKVAARLPREAAARLFLSPDLARRAVNGLLRSVPPGSWAVVDQIRDFAEASEYAGAALVVDDSAVTIQSARVFNPEKFSRLNAWWNAPPGPEESGSGPRLESVPPSTLALASLNVDAPALYRAVVSAIPERDRPTLEKLEIIAEGLLLGLDFRARVLPALGPRFVAYLEAPSEDPSEPTPRGLPLPLVVATEIHEPADGDGGPSVAEALDNALRVVLAALSFEKARAPEGHLEIKDGVTALSVPFPFAFAVDRPGRRLTVGSSAQAVARHLEADLDPDAGSRFRRLREAAFPGYESFVCLDLAAIHDLAARHKDQLIALAARRSNRPIQAAAADMEQVMALVRLFDAGFLAGRVDHAEALVEHSLGLIPRPAE